MGFDHPGILFFLALRHVLIFFAFLQKRAPKLRSIRGSPNLLHQYGQIDRFKTGFWGNILSPGSGGDDLGKAQ